METHDPKIGTAVREGKTVYFAHARGKYFEHRTREEVLGHLRGAARNAVRYADFYDGKIDAVHQFLRDVIFADLSDLNTGFDSPLITHVSPADFCTVIQRCANLRVQIIGIEVFDIRSWPVRLLEVRHGKRGRRLVKAYRSRRGISLCATFDVGKNVPDSEKPDVSDKFDLFEPIGREQGGSRG